MSASEDPTEEAPPEPFAALRARPEVAALLAEEAGARAPGAGELRRQLALSLAALAGFTALGLGAAAVAASVCPPFGLVPLAVCGIGLWAAGRQLARVLRSWRAPLERSLARVLEPPEDEDRARRVHVALEGGERRALEASARLMRALAPGDLGLASLRGGWLLDFARLE